MFRPPMLCPTNTTFKNFMNVVLFAIAFATTFLNYGITIFAGKIISWFEISVFHKVAGAVLYSPVGWVEFRRIFVYIAVLLIIEKYCTYIDIVYTRDKRYTTRTKRN